MQPTIPISQENIPVARLLETDWNQEYHLAFFLKLGHYVGQEHVFSEGRKRTPRTTALSLMCKALSSERVSYTTPYTIYFI